MFNKHQPHLTNSVLMVQPVDFGYNEQTGVDNEFQNRPSSYQTDSVRSQANKEFNHSVEILANAGIDVLVLNKSHTEKPLPDAVFPNNWFSTQSNGNLIIYPMKTPNRQDEVQISQLVTLANSRDYQVNEIIDLRQSINETSPLEGTGSLIFHHPTNRLFAAISERCVESSLETFANQFGYELIKFETSSQQGSPIYHTNVLMSCGEDFAVITRDIIKSTQQEYLLDSLSDCINEIIIINEQQMSETFCGNILQLKDHNNQPVIILSGSAYDGFNPNQIKQLERHGSLIRLPIPTIEKVGGGSARCMLAENFLPKKY